MAYISNKQIQGMSYNQIGAALVKGTLTEARLRDYYAGARRTAMSRAGRVSKTTEFGDIEKPTFMKTKNLPTTQALVREIADVNRYLTSKRSTITGLKQERASRLASLEKHGFDFVNESNYGDFINFMAWFKNSEFAKYYDSNDDEVAEVFEAAESATPEEWSELFEEFLHDGDAGNGDNTIQEY